MFNSKMFNQGPFNGVPGEKPLVPAVQYLEMLYIFDSTEKLITTLPKGSFFNAVHREVLNGENTFQFTISANSEHSEYVVEGNLIAFRDLDSYWQVFEVKRIVDVHGDGLTRTAYCEHIFYELLDDIVTDKRPSADATAALAGMLDNTRWQVGIVDDLGASSTSAYYESALSAVQKVANAWHGELNWRCVISGGTITRYVDLLAMRGTDTGKQFAYSKDILNIEREVDSSGVVTALYGRGKGVETESGAYGRRLTFADVEAPGKPLGQEWIGDDDALSRWGRNGRHRFDVFIDEEETDPAKLLQKTRDELGRRKVPRATYRLDVVSLEELTGYEHEKVRLGDMVRVIDREFEPELVVSARVIEIERDLFDPTNTKVVLGSFAPTIVESTVNINRRVNEMANRPFNTKWLDGKISVLQNEIENVQSYVFQTAEDGILILDAPTYDQATKAMKLGGGMFAIANQKDGNGGWNWRTFGDGSGFTADLITAGIIDAGLVQIGPQTTFAPGYDPSQIEGASAVGMGVDSDCIGLWHFDGSLNSHKGVAAIGDANFDTGCFGHAVKVEEGTTNIHPNGSVTKDVDSNNIPDAYDFYYKPDGESISWLKTGGINGTGAIRVDGINVGRGAVQTPNKLIPATAGKTYTASAYYKIPQYNSGVCVFYIEFLDSTGTRTSMSSTSVSGQTLNWTRVSLTALAPANTAYVRIWSPYVTAATPSMIIDMCYFQIEAKDHTTPFVDGTRLGVLKASTTGLSASQGAISFRAKNLAESGNGSVLVDLPKSDNTQGLQAGISNVAGHEGKIYITDGTSTAYGPNKSTLTGWDSISLAWKSDRLSLVVNDEEACYIENPGLPTALGSYLFIGTDRNGANAINTLVDELRIDKVYRDVNIRTGWHKTGVPFYTSEDMKQWPGYLKAETDGLKVYDSNDALRVLVGSWLKDAVRKYGIKIVDGEIYSSLIRTGLESATRYIALEPPNELAVYAQKSASEAVPYEVMRFLTPPYANAGASGFEWSYEDAAFGKELYAWINAAPDTKTLTIYSKYGQLMLAAGDGVYCAGDFRMQGGTKYNIEYTENYGIRGLAVRESPEQKYVDEGFGTLENGFCKIDIDPIFMECIEPHTEHSKWHIHLTPYADVDIYVAEIGDDYFIVKEKKNGTNTGAEFTWSLSATRINYAGIRLMEVVN